MRLLVSGATATVRRCQDSPFLGHLLVPGAGNSMRDILATGLPWAADNAAFSGFDPASFCSLLGRIAGRERCLFVACPDLVGGARATLARFAVWQPVLAEVGHPVALVGQDGLEDLEPPWGWFTALFLGGSTEWKLSRAAADLAAEAKRRGCWVHMGRCNTRRRLEHALLIGCDSVDGSGFSRWPDRNLVRALRWLAALHGTAWPDKAAQKEATAFVPAARGTGVALLDLPGWVVDRVQRSRLEYRVWARYAHEPTGCPRCGAPRGFVRRHGVREQRVRDCPRNAQRVTVLVTRQRYGCRVCGSTFLQPLPDVADGGRMTRRLVQYIQREAVVRPYSTVAREVGVDEKTVRNLVGRCRAISRASSRNLRKSQRR